MSRNGIEDDPRIHCTPKRDYQKLNESLDGILKIADIPIMVRCPECKWTWPYKGNRAITTCTGCGKTIRPEFVGELVLVPEGFDVCIMKKYADDKSPFARIRTGVYDILDRPTIGSDQTCVSINEKGDL